MRSFGFIREDKESPFGLFLDSRAEIVTGAERQVVSFGCEDGRRRVEIECPDARFSTFADLAENGGEVRSIADGAVENLASEIAGLLDEVAVPRN
jgi:hypothetical protein